MKKTYRVTAIQQDVYEITIEATSKKEAEKIAEGTDEGWNFHTYLDDWTDYQAEEEA